jgi:chromate transport protein ChrA
LSAKIGDTRLSMAVQMENPAPGPLLATIAAWCGLPFLGYGLLSRPHLTTVGALALVALAVSSAIVLILQLSQPYAGLFEVTPEAFDPFIEKIGR